MWFFKILWPSQNIWTLPVFLHDIILIFKLAVFYRDKQSIKDPKSQTFFLDQISKSFLEALVSLGMFFVRFVGAVLGGTLCVILGKTFGQFSRRFWRWVFRQFFKCFWHFSKLFQLSKLFDLSSFDLVVQVSQNTVSTISNVL